MVKWKDFCVQKKLEASPMSLLLARVGPLFSEVMSTTKDVRLFLASGYRHKH